jgi:hypothetical protein
MTELHYMDAGRGAANSNLTVKGVQSNLRIEIEKGVEAVLQLLFDFLLAAFEHVHGDVRLIPVLQFESRIPYFGDFFRG